MDFENLLGREEYQIVKDPAIAIEIGESGKVVAGGQTIAGNLIVTVPVALKARGIHIQAKWFVPGHDAKVVCEQVIDCGTIPAGKEAFPFSLKLPNGPFSCDESPDPISWLLKAWIDIPLEADAETETSFHMIPGPSQGV